MPTEWMGCKRIDTTEVHWRALSAYGFVKKAKSLSDDIIVLPPGSDEGASGCLLAQLPLLCDRICWDCFDR